MGKNGKFLPGYMPGAVIVILIALSAVSCTVPRIIVMEDPLTAAEHNDLGIAYEHKGLLDLAEKEFLRAVKCEESWAIPYFNLGNLYYRKGDHEKAEQSYREALARDERYADALNNLAFVLCGQGRYGEAKALIEKALAIEHKQEYLDTERKILEYMKEKE